MSNDHDVQIQQPTGDPWQGSAGGKELAPREEPKKRAQAGILEKGWVRNKLVREIATGEKPMKQLAEEYGVSQNSITNFKKRHAMAIQDVRDKLGEQFSGLWVAEKQNRLAELQLAAEKMARSSNAREAEVLVSILKSAAEELGQLPARTQVNVSTEQVTYQVVGINPEDLQ